MPVTLIGESVFARCLSSLLEEREKASTILRGPAETKYDGDRVEFVEAIRQALYASKAEYSNIDDAILVQFVLV